MRKFVFILAAVLIASGCSRKEKPAAISAPAQSKPAATVAQQPPSTGVEVGSLMPGYTATRLDGSKLDLAAEKGKVVFLNVWATWCAPCRAEIPELQKLHDKYASRQFEVVGVSVDEGNGDDVRKFVQEYKMTYPVALDPDG
ncbi:MAG TPA: TlpA disulfide reductase family protein, partial [Syntrophales bacterium]